MILNVTTVLVDMIHLLKIFLFCDLLFGFRKHKESQRYVVAYVVVASVSEIIYCFDTDIIELALYIISICVVLCIVYAEKKVILMLSAFWLTLITSLVDTMTGALVDIVYNLVGIGGSIFRDLVVSSISAIFIWVIGAIYKRKYSVGIKKIGIKNLIFFTGLVFANSMVSHTIIIIGKKEMNKTYENIFFVMSVVVIIGILFQLAAVILLFISNGIYKERDVLMKKLLNEQKEHYEYLERREEATKKFRHDIRGQMETLESMIEKKSYDEINSYFEQINMQIEKLGNKVSVNNGIADAVINKYYNEAVSKGIDINVSGKLPSTCDIDAYDLCTILSNVLSNAVEAAEKTDNRKITLDCRYSEDDIIIIAKNTYVDMGQFDGDEFITTKADRENHGYGLKNIRDAVKRNNGMLKIETEDNMFCMTIVLENVTVNVLNSYD